MKQFRATEIANWCDGEWDGDISSLEITGFTKDSRAVSDSDCYVALVGENFDGHDFVSAAEEAGALAAIVCLDYSGESALPLLRVADTVRALQKIAGCYRRKLDPFIIGVTGSSGKTTVKEMIASCMRKEFCTASTEGNLNNHIGLPMSLLEMEEETECGVFEIGMNHPGEVAPLCEVLDPDWGVVTNVGPVHLEAFDCVEAIAREKAVLLERSGEMAFLDKDGKYFDFLASRAAAEVVTVGRAQDSDYVYSEAAFLNVLEKGTGESVSIDLPVPGLHMAYDATLAVAVARKRGIGWESISDALGGFEPLPMRWQVSQASGVRLVDDSYNANPMSMRASINAFLSENPEERKFLVLGDMLELGDTSEAEHRRLGAWLSTKPVAGLVTVGEESACIAEASGLDGAVPVMNSEQVSGEILKALQKGDAILFKGSRGVQLEKAVSSVLSGLSK